MKFENDYLRIIIEKKKLSMEQKEARKLKWKKRRPAMGIALLLVIAITAGTLYAHFHTGEEVQEAIAEEPEGAASQKDANGTESEQAGIAEEAEQTDSAAESGSGEDDEKVEGTYVSTNKLVAGLKEKYAKENLQKYTYGEPIEDLKRDEVIQIPLQYDPTKMEAEYWREFYAVYQNPELTQELVPNYSWDEESMTLSLAPPNYTINMISASFLDTETVNKYSHSQNFLFDNGNGTNWGNLGTLYLACYRDEATGEILEKPQVSIITLQAELEDTPKLSYSILDDGRPRFNWTEVEGAEEYLICETQRDDETGFESSMMVIGQTTDTTWTTEAPEYGGVGYVNTEFNYFRVCEDSWKDESTYEIYKDEYEPNQVVPTNTEFGEPGICVIAISEKGTSMISNVYEYKEIAPNLPCRIAYNTARENGFADNCEKVEEIPIYQYVTMCDGYTVMKLIDYDTEKASVTSERFINVDENGEYVNGEDVICLNIPYTVEGTPFSYSMRVTDYDESRPQEDMKFIEDREEGLRKKSGDVAPDFNMELEEEEEAQGEETREEEIRQVETAVYGNSALTEYLAMNMLSGTGVIDISDFPEAKDIRFVDDAFMEAYYQNPLILGIEGYRINKKGTAIRVAYEDTAQSQAEKQQAIQNKVSEIIAEIITNDMTDREKELAINQYLCDTVVYDNDALANAEENNFMYVDEEFNDSFNAYGALINGKCVCAGYAAAFKLLASEAGLDTIVVTGFLDGSLAHAWNKIKIDGEWQIVDVTNNDNEHFFNALLNLPSSVGDRVLVEDKEYMIDEMIPDYVGESDENEYYHITDNYFPAKEIAEKLAEELAADGTATLRTDYTLNDSQFYDITDAVYEIMGDEIDLYGYYWLGVIYLSTEGE